ncbi:MAG: amidohydrolase family protein [Saprospiraceae bacterium]|nr:amidohydrolase family protein [Saprospiraceae bacterium]
MLRREFIHQSVMALSAKALLPERSLPGTDLWKLDTHVHFFDLRQFRYPWLQNASKINHDFTVEDYREATREADVGQFIFMESGAAPEFSGAEARWVSKLANENQQIKGIIAQIDLSDNISDVRKFNELKEINLLKGGRGKFIPDSNIFIDNLNHLGELDLTFDLLLSWQDLEKAAKLIEEVPRTTFILDHLGNPGYQDDDFPVWKEGIKALAALPNVNCKISGMISRIGPDWKLEDIQPYFDHAYRSFGADRLLYGGDWPVVLLADSYQSWSDAFEVMTAELPVAERKMIYHQNAKRIYNL